jgi:hypothetical protein
VLYSQADARDRLLDDDVTSVTAAQFEASFRVTGKLGYGAYSDVYSCVHQGTAKALKVLRPGECAHSWRTTAADAGMTQQLHLTVARGGFQTPVLAAPTRHVSHKQGLLTRATSASLPCLTHHR